MANQESYQNFLKSFLNEGIYCIKEEGANYQNNVSLGELNEQEPSHDDTNSSPVLIGNPTSDILFIFNENGEGWINANNKNGFLKMLQAIHYDLNSVAIFDITRDSDDGLNLTNFNRIIGFNSQAFFDFAQEAEKYKVNENSGKKFLWADSYEMIDTDIPKKRKLWSALQEMFPEIQGKI